MADDTKPKSSISTLHEAAVVPMQVYAFDGKGGVKAVDESQAAAAAATKGFTLVSGNSGSPDFRIWLRDQLGETQADTLTTPDMRSRCTVMEDRAMVVFRVARSRTDPEDIRRQTLVLWLEKGRVIIASKVHLPELLGIRQWEQSHHAPVSPADLVARLGLRAADRFEPLVEKVSDGLDDIEEEVMNEHTAELSTKLTGLRRSMIRMRRVLWPQRDVLNTLEIEDLSFLTPRDRARLREAAGRAGRLADELQSLSERAALVHEQILDTRSEQMNRTMMVLASVTVVAMPMTVISGILGMNVAGIPFQTNPEAFWAVVIGLLVIGVGTVWFMHAKKWL
jgi:zinc transporter